MVKNPPTNAGNARDAGSIPGLGRFSEERKGNALQYSHLGNPMNRGAWWATVHGVTKVGQNLATEQLTKCFWKVVFHKLCAIACN